jgi:hypothetical protein
MNAPFAGEEAQRALIIAEIRRLAGANGGKPPGAYLFERRTGLPRSSWYGKYWSRWSDAVREAGFAANPGHTRHDDGFMLAKFAEIARSLGRIPTFSDIDVQRRKGRDVPNHVTYVEHFGNKRELLTRLKLCAAANPDAADIAAMIPECEQAPPLRRARSNGGVYLLHSGKRFKIGCSKALEQRVRRIQRILPESKLVHCIESDDPRGIEAYWHRRFAAKRVKGEWFELSAEDVAAFRRWRVQ